MLLTNISLKEKYKVEKTGNNFCIIKMQKSSLEVKLFKPDSAYKDIIAMITKINKNSNKVLG